MLPATAYNEKELLLQLSEGNEAAFKRIYLAYSPRVYNKILRFLKCDFLTQEVLQDVFVAIWSNRHKIDSTKCFSSYIFCIAVNKGYDAIRKSTSEKKCYSQLMQWQQRRNIDVEEGLINKEDTKTLYRLIDLLPPKRKLIFTLCKVDGKSYEEVSRQLGISLSTISDHITGGNINNVVHFASLKAYERRSHTASPENCHPSQLAIYLDDVITGIKRELLKEGKPFATA